MSKAWKNLEKEKGIEHQKTTVYHLQSNGQVKQANRKIKGYSRKFVNHNQDDWSGHLFMLEFAYNMKKADQRTFTLYQIVYEETSAVIVKERMTDIHKKERLQKEARKVIQKLQAREYKENDWIYLQRREG